MSNLRINPKKKIIANPITVLITFFIDVFFVCVAILLPPTQIALYIFCNIICKEASVFRLLCKYPFILILAINSLINDTSLNILRHRCFAQIADSRSDINQAHRTMQRYTLFHIAAGHHAQA